MKVAYIAGSNVQVEIVAVNGGWSTVRDPLTEKTMKVRNGSLERHTEINQPVTVEAVKAVKTKKAAEAAPARAKLPLEQRKNGAVDALYLQFYKPYTVDGKRSMDKGDAVAVALRSLDLDGVYGYAAKTLGESVSTLGDRFRHLNPGMQRMNLGNMIRRALRKETKNA